MSDYGNLVKDWRLFNYHHPSPITITHHPSPITKLMFIVISYDISEDKRRTKIHKILKSYGQWMQFSVFECELTGAQYAKLRSRLSKLIKPNEDSIRFYFLCGCCQPKIERIGGEQPLDTTIFFA